MREFLLRPLGAKVADIRDQSFVALKVNDSQEDALNIFRKYDRTALPVVDSNGVLVGIVTIDDMLDVAEEEATEDIQKLGGMEALDEPYTTISMMRMIKKRAGWLVLLFLSEMFTSNAMAHFQDEIAKAVVLALFVPLMISSGGNSGSQATTLVIRAMAVAEIRLRDWWRVMGKELTAGALLGMILGAVGFFRIMAWQKLSTDFPARVFFSITNIRFFSPLQSFFALLGIVTWGTLIGSMLPFILRRVGLDPATSSAPFVATLVDVTGIFIYFTVAAMILRGTVF